MFLSKEVPKIASTLLTFSNISESYPSILRFSKDFSNSSYSFKTYIYT